MADNYLETRYAQVFENNGGARVSTRPSIDSWLKRECEDADRDSSYKVHPLQAEALIRTLRIAFPEAKASYDTCQGDGSLALELLMDSEFDAGRAFQIVVLKASEMGLRASLKDGSGGKVLMEVFK